MKADFKLPLTERCQCKGVAYTITAAPLAVLRAIARNASGSRAAPSAFPCLSTEAQLLSRKASPRCGNASTRAAA